MFAVRTQFLATLWPMVELLRQCVQVVQNNDHMRSPDANDPRPRACRLGVFICRTALDDGSPPRSRRCDVILSRASGWSMHCPPVSSMVPPITVQCTYLDTINQPDDVNMEHSITLYVHLGAYQTHSVTIPSAFAPCLRQGKGTKSLSACHP